MEEPTFSAREEEEVVEEAEEEQALTGKEDLALRVEGTTSRERLMGITARVEGTTRPWYSKSLVKNQNVGTILTESVLQPRNVFTQTIQTRRQST